ncbi:hypothetical protein [Ottowia thiooxydans]|uniref:hypothetical protein n=1 Tax=Ottowia thiooxydans TaxID=219182 RepID=UPI00041FF156|nr:hypothetical protein [Ottowia thiooxydans]
MNRWTKFTQLFSSLRVLALAGLMFGPAAQAQIRNFPDTVLRGEIAFVAPPQILLNGQSEFLAPGVRVRTPQNMLALTGTLVGQNFLVNYLRDPAGLIREIWILTPEEANTGLNGKPLPMGEPFFLGG